LNSPIRHLLQAGAFGTLLLASCCFLGLAGPAFGSESELTWVKQAGGDGAISGEGVAALSDGSSVVTGYFGDTATFGSGEAGETQLTSAGSFDIFVARYAPNGTLEWARRAGGTGDARGCGVAALSDDSVVVAGYFSGTVTFAPGEPQQVQLTSGGGIDIFLAKYTSDGTLSWAKRAGGSGDDYARGITAVSGTSAAITGDFNESCTFGPGEGSETVLNSAGAGDIYVASYSSDGTLSWAKRAGSATYDGGHGIVGMNDGSVVISGKFTGTVNFGGGHSVVSAGNKDVFVTKYDSAGSTLWAKRAGGSGFDFAYAATALTDNSVVLTGRFRHTATFGPGEANETQLVASGMYDIFVAKYGSDGTLDWAKKASGVNSEYGFDVVSLADNSVVLTGFIKKTVTFGQGEVNETQLTSNGFLDVFLARYNPDGTLAWAKNAGGASNDYGRAIAAMPDDTVVVTGYFLSEATFGSGEAGETVLTSGLLPDMFLAKFSAKADTLVIYVDQAATGTETGLSWENAYTNLQTALAAARPSNEIWVADGTYKPTSESDRSSCFVLRPTVPLYGGFAGTENERSERNPAVNIAVLSGDIGEIGVSSDNSYHVVRGTTGGTLDGFTITGGNASGTDDDRCGGGLFVDSASPTIANCTFSNNSATLRGGGAYLTGSSPTLTACVFTGNSAQDGGGLANVAASNPTLNGCAFNGNSSTNAGGGLFNTASSPLLSNCSFVSNTSSKNGGGIYNAGAAPELADCLFDSNVATQYGGAIASYATSNPQLLRCIFSANSGSYWGGGIYNNASSATATNCTFNRNTAGRGGAVGNSASTVTLRNCILWNDAATKSGDEIHNSASTTTATYSCVRGGHAGEGNLDMDPLFVDENGGDYHLKSTHDHWTPSGWVTDEVTSPCVASGDPADDYENEPLPNGEQINMGAYGNTVQASKRGPITIYVDKDASGIGNGTSWANAFTDLQVGIAMARSGDAVWVAAAEYRPGSSRDDTFLVKDGVGLYGGFDATETLLSERDWETNITTLSGDIGTAGLASDNSFRVVTGGEGSTLDGFTVAAGYANDAAKKYCGAGMYNQSVTMTVANCVFRDCYADFFGAGMYCENSMTAISNSRFIDNASWRGAALYNYGNSGTISGTVFTGSVSDNFGGAVANTAGSNGTWINCVFAGNSGAGGGGAIFNHDSSPTLINCTMSGNTGSPGKAVYNFSGTLAMKNCILWGGSSGLVQGTCTVTYCCVQGGHSGAGNISSDPRFFDSSDPCGPDGVFATDDDGLKLQASSPCKDAATADGAPNQDIKGFERPEGDGYDMGAYEQSLSDSVVFVDADAVGAANGTSWADAFTTLQAGLETAAPTHKEVWVAEGTYKPGASRSNSFLLRTGVAVYGGFSGIETGFTQRNRMQHPTVLSGDIGVIGDSADNCYHVVVGATGATLDGFTITGGNANGAGANGSGAGIYNSGASPTVSNCVLAGNFAVFYGGGMVNLGLSAPPVTNCVFTGNQAGYWGGGAHCNASSPTLTNCTFSGNNAARGGALAATNGAAPDVSNCVFYGDSATLSGNEIYGGGVSVTYSCVQGGFAGTGNIDADPLFTDVADPDGADNLFATADDGLQLGSASPCRDSGTSEGAPGEDILGVSRSAGGDIDMGAYERTLSMSVVFVDADANGNNNGTSWADAFNELQSGLDAAEPTGKEVWVATGTYKPPAVRTASFQLRSGVNVYGGFAGTETARSERDWNLNPTVLSGDIGAIGNPSDNSIHVLLGADSARLDGFRITGGNADGTGSNRYGGGMYNNAVSPVVANCTFDSNAAYEGGAAMANSGCAPEINKCVFRDNIVSHYGAGIANYNSAAAIVTNCVFDRNTGSYWGGGIYNNGSSPSIVNCVFSGNVTGRGGAVANAAGSAPAIKNCILWGNTATASHNEIYSSASSPTVSYSCIQGGYTGTGNISSDPQFADAAGGDFHVKSQEGRWNGSGWSTDATTSPCIDAGDLGDDCSNEPSPNGSRVNMGAYGNTDEASKTFTGGALGGQPPPPDDEESEDLVAPQHEPEEVPEEF